MHRIPNLASVTFVIITRVTDAWLPMVIAWKNHESCYLLERTFFLLLGAVDDDTALLPCVPLWELWEEDAVDGAAGGAAGAAAAGVSTWGTGCLLALKAAALMVYLWHWGGFHMEPPSNILNFSVFHFVGESPLMKKKLINLLLELTWQVR